MKRVRVFGRNFSHCEIEVPGSKSVANRALVCAAMADGMSTLLNVPDGDDTALMIEGLRALGCQVIFENGTIHISHGPPKGEQSVWCGLGGTTSRFLTAYAAVVGERVLIDGEERLRERPMRDLHDALRQIGATLGYLGEENHLPVIVSAPTSFGRSVHIRGDVSSQFVSALMLIGPAIGGLDISLSTDLVSQSYVEMTAKLLRHFGASVSVKGRRIVVADARYSPKSLFIEPDFSSAAFVIAVGVISGDEVVVKNLGLSHSQGDSRILEIARSMGADVVLRGDDVVVSRAAGSPLRPIHENLRDCSDLVPVVAVMSLFSEGESKLDGIGFIREKESNRLDDLAIELRKVGGSVTVEPDGLVIRGGRPLHTAALCVHDDHRLAMAFAVLGSALSGVELDDGEVVRKSWPSFWRDMDVVLFTESA